LRLETTEIEKLKSLPETGMGFQLIEALVGINKIEVLVFNCDRALDLSRINLEPGDDPVTVLGNGLRVVEAVKREETELRRPLHSIRLLNARIGPLPAMAAFPAGKAPRIALPSSLVKRDRLTKNRPFHRFSAFKPDCRVDPKTGSFIAGTYAAPESEVKFVPTGFVAVGRFALPNKLPACYQYEIEAPAGTIVDFGTVAPAFGQAGGGVEAYFPSAVTNAKGVAAVTTLPED
jgi:hypothetical protein